MHCILGCAVLGLSLAPHVQTVESPWSGTWKVNEARSKYARRTFTISRKGRLLHYSNGGTNEYDFACDGEEYATTTKQTVSCTKADERTYDIVTKVDGKELSRSQRRIAEDGKTLVIETSGREADGSLHHLTQRCLRLTGNQGLVGTWELVRRQSSEPRVMKISVAGETFHQEYLSTGETYEGKLDGSSIIVTGRTIAPGTTTEMKADGPRAIRYVMKVNGRETEGGREALSKDGTSLIDTYWISGMESQKTVEVFEKQ
jgi:hypothetical protein